MATWIAHLRIAENILSKGYNFDSESFAVGNIGPDSGVPNEDWSNFNPPKKVTHWVGDDNKINALDFWNKYLCDKQTEESNKSFSFMIGYFVHLLTDIEWSKLFYQKKNEPLYREGLEKDPNFIWIIKKDWYGLDYLYLEKNPRNIFNTLFRYISNIPDYLNYFPQGAFERQVNYITNFYLGENNQTKENFIYLNEEEMNCFIEKTTRVIDDILSELLIKKMTTKK